MTALRVVQTLTAGVDDIRPHIPEGVTLCNAHGVHDASTAELAVGLTLAALRGIPDYVRAAEHGRWAHDSRSSLADRRVLIVGYGAVGAAVEARLAGFEVEVRRVARHAREGVSSFESLASLLPVGRGRRAHRPDDRRDPWPGGRGLPGRAARRRAGRQRVPRPGGGDRRPARRGLGRPAARRAGRHRSRAAARRTTRCGTPRACSSARTWAATPRRSCRAPAPWSPPRSPGTPPASPSRTSSARPTDPGRAPVA